MRKYLAIIGLWLGLVQSAMAGVSCSVPFNLINGTTADASQVMANYNAILSCLSSSTAASGANSDITSLSGLTTPLSPAQGGTSYFIGGTSSGTNTVTLANPSPNGFAYTQGYVVTFLAGGTNTSAVTLNVNSLGAKNVYKQTLAGPVALTGSEIQSGQLIAAYYDGTQFEIVAPITPVAIGNISQTAPPYGFDMPINMGITASVGSNLLNVSVITIDAGSAPTATDPVLIPFQNAAVGSGQAVWVAATSALTINTNATGATLGCQNNVPCRFWVVVFNNGGTPVLALWQSGAGSATPSINPLVEGGTASSTAMSGGATSAGVFYTPNGTTVSNKAYRILGFVETTEATAGTYASGPSREIVFGPGIKKPGDVVQTQDFTDSTNETTASATYVCSTNARAAITPTSNVNIVQAQFAGVGGISNASSAAAFRLSRGTSANSGLFGSEAAVTSTSAGGLPEPISGFGTDTPATTSSTTYCLQFKSAGGNAQLVTASGYQLWIRVAEIQG